MVNFHTHTLFFYTACGGQHAVGSMAKDESIKRGDLASSEQGSQQDSVVKEEPAEEVVSNESLRKSIV